MKIHDITEARMGMKDIMTANTSGYTFGFEFEIAVNFVDALSEFPDIFKIDDKKLAKEFESERFSISYWWTNIDQGRIKEILKDFEPIYGYVPLAELDDIPYFTRTVFEVIAMPEKNIDEKKAKLYELMSLNEQHLGDGDEDKVVSEFNRIVKLGKKSIDASIEDYTYAFDDYTYGYIHLKNLFVYTNKSKSKYERLDKLDHVREFSAISKYFKDRDLLDVALKKAYLEDREVYKAEFLASARRTMLSRLVHRTTDQDKLAVDITKRKLAKEGFSLAGSRMQKRRYSAWKVTTDGSIDTVWGKEAGIEIVSPVFNDFETAMSEFQKVLTLIQQTPYFSTNDSVGLHMNVGREEWKNNEFRDSIDLLKLLIFIGERSVLQDFDRLENVYSKTIMNQLSLSVNKNNSAIDKFIQSMNNRILSNANHYNFMDLRKLKMSGYIEIRSAGSANYENEFVSLKEHLLRYLRAFSIASDPNAYKKEYYKRIYRLLNNKVIARFPGYDSRESPYEGAYGVSEEAERKAKMLLQSLIEKVHNKVNFDMEDYSMETYVSGFYNASMSPYVFLSSLFSIQLLAVQTAKKYKKIVVFDKNDLLNIRAAFKGIVMGTNKPPEKMKQLLEELTLDSLLPMYGQGTMPAMQSLWRMIKPMINGTIRGLQ